MELCLKPSASLGPRGPHILILVCLELLQGKAQQGSSAGHQGRPSSEASIESVLRKLET